MTPELFDVLTSPAVLGLPGRNAQAARLVILERWNMRDAAQEHGITAGTVSRAVTRIRTAGVALQPYLK